MVSQATNHLANVVRPQLMGNMWKYIIDGSFRSQVAMIIKHKCFCESRGFFHHGKFVVFLFRII